MKIKKDERLKDNKLYFKSKILIFGGALMTEKEL